MTKRILVVSSANMDFVMRVSAVPLSGQTVIESGAYRYIPGGKGGNSALALARLGADCIFCAKLGADAHGAQLKQFYTAEGIDTRFITADRKDKTGLAVIMVEPDGANRIVVYPGANFRLTPVDIEDAFTCCPDALYLQFELPRKTILTAVKYAHSQSVPVFIDAGPADPDFPLEELGRVEIFSPNETETAVYTGIVPNNVDNCLRAAIKLSTVVAARYYVIKLGGRGAFVYNGKYYQVVPAYECPVVDTTAAGDAFTAALTFKYMQCGNIVQACKYANAAGAVTVGREGASASIPTAAEVAAFIEANGIEM